MYPKKGYKLDSVFSNSNNIEYDTVLNLKDKGYNMMYSNLKILVKSYFENIGKRNVRGVLEEVDMIKGNIYTQKYFIDLEYHISDTVSKFH